jgi:hypothetical protein
VDAVTAFILGLSAVHGWFVSGTPFPKRELVDAARLFLGLCTETVR